jgi:hypothetical protein
MNHKIIFFIYFLLFAYRVKGQEKTLYDNNYSWFILFNRLNKQYQNPKLFKRPDTVDFSRCLGKDYSIERFHFCGNKLLYLSHFEKVKLYQIKLKSNIPKEEKEALIRMHEAWLAVTANLKKLRYLNAQRFSLTAEKYLLLLEPELRFPD